MARRIVRRAGCRNGYGLCRRKPKSAFPKRDRRRFSTRDAGDATGVRVELCRDRIGGRLQQDGESAGCRVGAADTRTRPTGSPATESGEERYLALGDSLSQGVGAVDEADGAFPALLAERWRADGCEVELQNAGVSGYTAGQILDEQVPQIDSFKPTIITFQAGGNDNAKGVPIDEYRDNVKSVLDSATGSGARVVVLAQNEWFRLPMGVGYAGEDGAARRSAYDDVMIEETSAHGAEFVDMRPRSPWIRGHRV
jgi:acyl-CoA thioesterase-1